MKNNKLIILSTLFFITIVSMVFQNCCPPKSIPPVVSDCPSNMKMENGNCICDNMSYWDGVQCVNMGFEVNGQYDYLLTSINGTCNDWRDSLFFILNKTSVISTSGALGLYKKAGGSGKFASIASVDFDGYNMGTYDSISSIWSEMMDVNIGQNYRIHEFGFFAKINKTRDTIWANICNATFLPGPLVYQDTCKVVMVNVKKQQ